MKQTFKGFCWDKNQFTRKLENRSKNSSRNSLCKDNIYQLPHLVWSYLSSLIFYFLFIKRKIQYCGLKGYPESMLQGKENQSPKEVVSKRGSLKMLQEVCTEVKERCQAMKGATQVEVWQDFSLAGLGTNTLLLFMHN